MDAPEPKDTTARLLHYGEILLELDQAAEALANQEGTRETELPAVRFVAHRHFFRVRGWILERED